MNDPKVFEGRKEGFVWVKDKSGNEFLCPSGEIKDPSRVSKSELVNCVDDTTASVNPRGG